MQTLTLTNFAGLNTKSPEMELSTQPVESPNIINAIMEEGTIFCRAPQNIHYSAKQLNDGKIGNVNTFYTGKLGNNSVNIVQVDNIIRKNSININEWWNNNWTKCRKRIIKNHTLVSYYNLILEWKLPIGFDYSNIKDNGEDLRFIVYDKNLPQELPYWIKEWSKINAILLPTTNISLTMSLTSQLTSPAILKIIIEGATTWGSIKIQGKDNNLNNIEETLTFTANEIKETTKQFKSVNINGITTSGFTGGTIKIEGKKESIIFIKFSIAPKTDVTVTMYYGNINAEAQSNINLYNYMKPATSDLASYFNKNFYLFQFYAPEEKANLPTSFPPYRATCFFPPAVSLVDADYFRYNYTCYNSSQYDHMTIIAEAHKIYLKSKIKMTANDITGKVGFIIKLDGILNWGNNVFIGFRYFKGNFSWRGIEFEYENESNLYQYYFSEKYLTYQYDWQANTDYWIEILINKDKGTIYGKITDGVNTIYEKIISNLNISTALIQVGYLYLWSFLWSQGITFYMGWDEFFALYSDEPTQIEISNLLPETGKTAESDWTILYDSTYLPASTKPYQILNFLKKLIFLTEEDTTTKAKEIITWDGITTTTLPGFKKAKFGLVHKNRLWLFNFPEISSSMFWYSNINKIMALTDWQTSGIDNTEYINMDDGFNITAVGRMSDQIIVWKENAAYLIYGDIPNIYIKKLNINEGCIAWRSVAEWENGVFYVSKIGIHFIRGAVAETPIIFTIDNIQTDNLATKIIPTFNNLNIAYLNYAIGVVWNNRYFLAVPTYSSTTNNIILVLDYKAGWWSYWIPPEDVTSMFVDPINNVLFIGSTKGNIRLQEYRNFNENNVLEDNKLINSQYDTGYLDLGTPNNRKRLRFINVLFSGDLSIELDIDKNNITKYNLRGINMLNKNRIPVMEKGYFFKLRFMNFTKQIHSITLEFENIRN